MIVCSMPCIPDHSFFVFISDWLKQLEETKLENKSDNTLLVYAQTHFNNLCCILDLSIKKKKLKSTGKSQVTLIKKCHCRIQN